MGSAQKGIFSDVFCRLEHENGVVNLQGRTQLDTEYFNYVTLVQEQEGLTIYLLEDGNTGEDED